MTHLRRTAAIAPIAAIAALLVSMTPALGAGTVATFVDPAPGVIPVLAPGSSYTASWTEAGGAAIQSRTVVVQTSRATSGGGCDPRWVPATSSTPNGHSVELANLAGGRCYRLVLELATEAGPSTVFSTPVAVLAGSFGPTLTFTNPIRAGLVVYEARNVIGWAEGDTFGARINARSLTEQSAPAVSGGCKSVDWTTAASTAATPSGASAVRTLAAGTCYRYTVTLTDSRGYRRSFTSQPLGMAVGLPAWTGTVDLFRSSAFVTQHTITWCVGASSQMMINLIMNESDTSYATQQMYMTYAYAHDAADYPISFGTDPQGWVAMLKRYGGGDYTAATYSNRTAAVKAIAKRMRLTNKPVGIIVMDGGHAWVVNGFSATADPATTDSYTVTGLYVSGPLYPRPANRNGYDLPPDTKLALDQLAKYYTAYWDWTVTTWNGWWVVIQP